MNILKKHSKIIIISFVVAISFFLIGYVASSVVGSLNKTGISENPDENATNLIEPGTNPTNQTDMSASGSSTELPKQYPPETAINNGDYVNIHGKVYNGDVITDFINKVEKKEEAFIRTVIYTVEGDPIVIDFSYNSKYFSVTKDTSRDKHGKGEITNCRFDNLVIYEDVNPDRYGNGKRTYYIVTDLSEITAETFNGIDGEVLKYE